MNTRTKTAIVFFLGVLVGLGTTMAIGFYKIKKDSGWPLIGPKVFGDIRIYQETLKSKEDSLSNRCRSLVLERNGIELVQVNQLEPGRSGELFVGNNNHLPIIHIKFAKDDEDYSLRYGRLSSKHEDLHQKFLDFDMNGQFDYLINFDNKGQVNAETAYLQKSQEWVTVSESGSGKRTIKINDKNYEFRDHDWKEVASLKDSTEPNNADIDELRQEQ